MARLPWWAGLGLAVTSYLALHAFAERPVPAPAPGGPASAVVLASLLNGLAHVGQYVLPLRCVAGAGVSALRRRERAQVLASASQGASAVDGMRWQEFEMLVGEAFRRQRYRAVESGGGGADGGADLVLSRPARNGSAQTLVQCKPWRAHKVGVDVVRQLYGVMAARGAAAGIVVTSGRYTAEAKAFAQGRNLQLIDGKGLIDLIQLAPTPAPRHSTSSAATRPSQPSGLRRPMRHRQQPHRPAPSAPSPWWRALPNAAPRPVGASGAAATTRPAGAHA